MKNQNKKSLTRQEKVRVDSRPLYLLAEERLLKLIEEGRFKAGERLPSEPVLAHDLGISRSTLREALRVFEEEGIISRRPGVGTFILDHPPVIKSGLERLESLDSLARKAGLEAGTEELVFGAEKADDVLADKLQVAVGEDLVSVSRIKTTAERPIAYMYDLVREKVVSLEEMRQDFRGSVLDTFLSKKLPVIYARSNITPARASRFLARKLRIPFKTPVLLLEETLYLKSGEIVSYSLNYFVREFFKFHVIRRLPSSFSNRED